MKLIKTALFFYLILNSDMTISQNHIEHYSIPNWIHVSYSSDDFRYSDDFIFIISLQEKTVDYEFHIVSTENSQNSYFIPLSYKIEYGKYTTSFSLPKKCVNDDIKLTITEKRIDKEDIINHIKLKIII